MTNVRRAPIDGHQAAHADSLRVRYRQCDGISGNAMAFHGCDSPQTAVAETAEIDGSRLTAYAGPREPRGMTPEPCSLLAAAVDGRFRRR